MTTKKFIHLVFILSGAKLYFNWILPTNPASKNPIIKKIWGKQNYTMCKYKSRLTNSYFSGVGHMAGVIVYIFIDMPLWTNILINIYPVIIQIYIGFRCFKIIQSRKKITNYSLAPTIL